MSGSYAFNALPASKVTSTPVLTLPTEKATVLHTRLIDTVDDVQHLTVVKEKSIFSTVPVVEAKPTQRKGVYTASIVLGKPDLHIKIDQSSPTQTSQAKNISKEHALLVSQVLPQE